MNQVKFLLLAAFAMISFSALAHDSTDSLKVYGNCGMCKTRIETAAKLDGVKKAEWNVETNMLTVMYDGHKVKLDDIERSLALVGHDTDKFKAEASIYKKLPGCCKYDRKTEKKKTADKTEDHSGHN